MVLFSISESGQEERPRSCDRTNVSVLSMANDEEYLTERNPEEETHPESDVLCDENSHGVKCSKDDVLHYNNNARLSSEGFLPHGELTNSAKSELPVVDEGSSIGISQEDQGFTDNVTSGAPCETDEVQSGNILDSSNGSTANVKSNFEESPEEDKSNFPVTVEEAPVKMEDAERSISPSSDTQRLINSNAEIEQTALSSLSGSSITRDDNNLVTVIQGT